ncbi:hypothetical protein MASR1M8_15970 [Thermomonas brevis]
MTDEITTPPASDPAPERKREASDVKRWMDRVTQARKFDEPARKQYAHDRRYARGDSGFDIAANIAGSYIDILEAFYYAQDPAIDIGPAEAAAPPPMEALRDAAEQVVMNDPMAQQAAMQAAQGAGFAATAMGADPDMIAPQAQQAAMEQAISAKMAELQEVYARRSRETKAFAGTLEVITSRLWKDAGIQRRGRPWVRSALTVGIGWLKGSWQERTAPSPETAKAINDLQRDIARLKSMERDIADESRDDDDGMLAQYERELERLQQQPEPVVARGYVVDNPSPENVTVAPGVPISNYLDAPWMAERIPMRFDDAMAEFGLSRDQLKKATIYKARKVEMGSDKTPAMDSAITAEDAEGYVTTGTPGASVEGESDDYVMVVEVWDRDGGSVLTGIEGYPYWVKQPWAPTATTRFYPYFLLPISDVDGQRHPQSLISRTWRLFDEYNRINSRLREHRLRVIPQMMFDREQVDKDTADRLTNGVTGEWVGINTTSGNANLGNIAMPKPYPAFDPGMYDVQPIVTQIERIWSIQEALSGAVNKPKTATEAEIQQQGFMGRTSGRRDQIESVLGEMALYTAELARAHVTAEDAREIAGPAAFWPAYTGADELRQLVNVNIRAGSSGKPNTTAEREAWAATMPILMQLMERVGMLRNSTPADMAESLVEMGRITVQRSGDHIDIDQLFPKAGPAPAPMLAGPTDPNQPPQEQIA